MKHLGDITKIDWREVEPVDVVTGGSPCQDLSVAGKRAGLAGERSGLFMEQIRCVKELREQDVHRGRTGKFIRPRFMVWENVPGAFSSGRPKGSDFAAVIEEIIKVAEPGALVRIVPPDRGWSKSGCYYDADGKWSVAWRVHDAQFWGVPQRRKRIALVADFGGLAAPEVLFERRRLSWDFEQSGETREEAAGAVGGGAESAISIHLTQDLISNYELQHAISVGSKNGQCVNGVFCLQGNGIDRADTAGCNGKGWREDVSYTLNTIDRPAVATFSAGRGEKAAGIGWQEECPPSLRASDSGTNRTPTVYDARGNGDGQTVPTMTGDHQNRVTDYTALCVGNGQLNQMSMSEQANMLDTMHDQQAVLVSKESKQKLCVVRRLTPTECSRLQGFPDGWVDIGDWIDSKGKKHKEADSPKYKALGNSIALPFWKWLLKRISAQYERDATLGSLFDGISGFCVVWAQVNGPHNCRWCSEVEEFPIAVCKKHFGDEDTGLKGDYYKAILGRNQKENA